LIGLPDPFEIRGKSAKRKPRRLLGAGGVLEENRMIRKDRELPACLLGKELVREA
jgi:hypothetical protein